MILLPCTRFKTWQRRKFCLWKFIWNSWVRKFALVLLQLNLIKLMFTHENLSLIFFHQNTQTLQQNRRNCHKCYQKIFDEVQNTVHMNIFSKTHQQLFFPNMFWNEIFQGWRKQNRLRGMHNQQFLPRSFMYFCCLYVLIFCRVKSVLFAFTIKPVVPWKGFTRLLH